MRGLFVGIFTCVGMAIFLPVSAWAEFVVLSKRDNFLSVIEGKDLKRPLIRLQVKPDGTITGKAAAMKGTGTWVWEDRYFCRVLYWGGKTFEHNCQEVALNGDKIRFTTEKGAGEFADFTLK